MSKDVARRYLAEITRDRLGRFLQVEQLASCGTDRCELVPAEDHRQAIEQQLGFLAALQGWLASDELTRLELLEVVDGYREELRAEAGVIEDHPELLRHRPAEWVHGMVGDYADVSGLDGRTASTLALLLKSWNPGPGPVYRRFQDGKRRMRGGTWRVNLAHPLIASTIADDVRDAMRDSRTADEWEEHELVLGDDYAEQAELAARRVRP